MTDLPAAALPRPYRVHLDRVLRSLRANRAPGWHLPAHFLGLHFDAVESGEALVSMPVGSHCLDSAGNVHRAALTVLADVAMAGALRERFGTTARLATVNTRLNFASTGSARTVQATARCRIDEVGAAVPFAVCSVEIRSEDQLLCSGESTFVVLDNSRGTASHPLPRVSTIKGVEPLEPDELTAIESGVYSRALDAEALTAQGVPFIDGYWGLIPKVVGAAATCSFESGPHVCNRIGHVQGGLLLGLAIQTSAAVLPEDWRLIDASARYLAPADGSRPLSARAETVRVGRSTAFVECSVTDQSGQVALLAEVTLIRNGDRGDRA